MFKSILLHSTDLHQSTDLHLIKQKKVLFSMAIGNELLLQRTYSQTHAPGNNWNDLRQ